MFYIMWLAIVLNGCVAFEGHDLTSALKEEFAKPSNKIAINFTNQVVKREASGKETVVSDVKPIAEGYMLRESEFFLTTQSIPGKEDYTLHFKTILSADYGGFFERLPFYAYLSLSFLTLTIIPYFEKVERHLEVSVEKNNKTLKTYTFKDHVKKISSIVLLPFWRPSQEDEYWYEQQKMTRLVDHNLVKHFLKAFYHDFLQLKAQASNLSKSSYIIARTRR